MKIAAYCRVSTDKDEQLHSLAQQKEFFTAYAARNGHELIRIYADEGISGTSLKGRQAFRALMQDAQQGLFHMVVVKDISRFARNTVDALQSIRKLKSMGISTLFLTANMDSMGDSEFILTLFSAMAQEESNNLSKRVKWGKKISAEKGRVPQRIFGYDRVDNFTLAINPTEASIVRKIFTLYSEQGLGCRTISLQLNRDLDKTKFGSQWNPRGVRRILTNPIYGGILVNHKYEVEDFLTGRQIPVPEGDQFIHHRPCWAIVSPETFRKTQEILESRRQKFDSGESSRAGRYSSRHLFSTLIKCSHCGRSFTRKTYTYTNTRIYWRCVTNDQYTAETCDNRVTIDEPELTEALGKYFAALIGNREDFANELLSRFQPEVKSTEQTRQDLLHRKTKLLMKQERYQEMFANDLISLTDLKSKLADISDALQILSGALSQLEESADNPELHLQQYRRQIADFMELKTITNMDLRQIIDHIAVTKDGTVRIIMKHLPV